MATPDEGQPSRPILSDDDRRRIVEEERVRFEARQALERGQVPAAPASGVRTPEAVKAEATAIAIGIPALFIAGLVYFSLQHQEASRKAAEDAAQVSAAVEACRTQLTKITGPSSPLTFSYEPRGASGASHQVLIEVDGGIAGKFTIACTARQASDGTWGASLGPLAY